jgi:hypothetical protein
VPWIALDVGLAVIGLAVLALLAVRLFRQVRGLGREVARAGERLGAELAQLEQVAGSTSRRIVG